MATSKVITSDAAIRAMVVELLENKGLGEEPEPPVNVNAEVDPSVAVTDPVNPSFSPQDKVQFNVAVNNLVKNLPDDKMPKLYQQLHDAVDDDAEKEQEKLENDMNTKKSNDGTEKVEEAIRRSVRRYLAERSQSETAEEKSAAGEENVPDPTEPATPNRDAHTAVADPDLEAEELQGYGFFDKHGLTSDEHRPEEEEEWNPDVDADAEEAEREQVRQGHYGLSSYNHIDKDLTKTDVDVPDDLSKGSWRHNPNPGKDKTGASKPGWTPDPYEPGIHNARQETERAMSKYGYLSQMEDDDREIMTMSALKDYIAHLTTSGELSSADVALLNDHPEYVRELPGFREYLHSYAERGARGFRRKMKAGTATEESKKNLLGQLVRETLAVKKKLNRKG